MKKKDINFFSETTFRDERKKVGIKTDDRRRHIYIVGKTGTGKTAMVKNMAIQDIMAGRGIGFIDPHGEAAEDLLDFIPSNRINDVVYFNPADIDFPVAFNVMENVGSNYRHLVAAGLMDVFKKIWPDVWSARMEYILGNSILALLEYPNSTLLGINRILSDPVYREKTVKRVKDPVVKSFWVNEFARYSQRYEVEATAAIQNKIGQFISNPLIRNIVGQVKSKINMGDLMDEGKILIANLSKGRIGEDNSKLLGALLITKLQLAAMSRVRIPEEKRRDFFLYVDEFQNFVTESFANILSEARKYRLSLTLANQYISQLEEITATGKSTKVKDAVFGNVGTLISFRIGAEDAEYLEKEFTPDLMAGDFVNLSKYNIYLKLMVDGLAKRPFSAKTLTPTPKPQKSNREKIIQASRERYGTERIIIEEKINRWISTVNASKPVQKSNQKAKKMYDAQCALCGKKTKVIFEPDGVRPVYCKDCYKKQEKKVSTKNVETKDSKKASLSSPKEEKRVVTEKSSSKDFKEVPLLSKKQEKRVSLKKVEKIEPISFSASKKEKTKEKRTKKKVDVSELKKALAEALKKNDDQ